MTVLATYARRARDAADRLNAAGACSPDFEALAADWLTSAEQFAAVLSRELQIPAAQIKELLP